MNLKEAQNTNETNPEIDVTTLTDAQITEGFRNQGFRLYSNGDYVNRQIEQGLADKTRITAYFDSFHQELCCYLK